MTLMALPYKVPNTYPSKKNVDGQTVKSSNETSVTVISGKPENKKTFFQQTSANKNLDISIPHYSAFPEKIPLPRTPGHKAGGASLWRSSRRLL